MSIGDAFGSAGHEDRVSIQIPHQYHWRKCVFQREERWSEQVSPDLLQPLGTQKQTKKNAWAIHPPPRCGTTLTAQPGVVVKVVLCVLCVLCVSMCVVRWSFWIYARLNLAESATFNNSSSFSSFVLFFLFLFFSCFFFFFFFFLYFFLFSFFLFFFFSFLFFFSYFLFFFSFLFLSSKQEEGKTVQPKMGANQ